MMTLCHLLPGLLPPAVLALWIVLAKAARRDLPAADAVVRGAAAWALASFALAEGLGATHLLTAPALLAAWSTIAAVSAFLAIRCRATIREAIASLLPERTWVAVPIGILLALALAQIALYPPNTNDSLTYHLPRIEHWLANHSLAFYPTCIQRQLFSQPLAEILLLHLRALSGGDRLLGLVQWLAYAGCISLAWGQAALLGCGRRGKSLAALFAATVPMAILQASTTQNDLVAAFWILAAAYQLTRTIRAFAPRDAILFGATAGLACLTKGTAYPIVLPMVAAVAAISLWRWKTRLLPALAAGLLFLAPNLPHWARCHRTFGDIFGGQTSMFRPPADAASFAVEAWFHGTLHLAPLPQKAAQDLDRASEKLLRATGVDEHSKAHFFGGASPLKSRRFAVHQDFCPNPLHALLLLAAIAASLASFRKRDGRLPYALLFLAGGALFLLTVSWQPWLSRLQLPFFLLGAAPAGAMLEETANPGRHGGRIASATAAALLVAQAAVPALFSYDRALVPCKWVSTCNAWTASREHRYFAACRTLCLTYTSRADEIARRRPRIVGFTGVESDCEYLLWMLLRNRMGKDMPAIVYAGEGGAPSSGPGAPDIIMSLTQGRHRRPTLSVPGAPSTTQPDSPAPSP